MKTNWEDLALRTFWTAAAAGLAYLGTVVTDVEAGWQAIVTPAITLALVWVRQQVPDVR